MPTGKMRLMNTVPVQIHKFNDFIKPFSMNYRTLFLIALLTLICASYSYGQVSTDRSFVDDISVKKPGITSASQVSTLAASDKIQAVNYYDGLGRPLQTIAVQAFGTAEDLVTPEGYDNYGRKTTTFLPYPSTCSGCAGSFRATGYVDQKVYYASTTAGTAQDNNPYAQTLFEFSPLDRSVENGQTGATWQPGSGHTVKIINTLNTSTDNIKIWKVTDVANDFGTYAVTGNYAASTLYKQIVTDENGKQTITFKDQEGRLLFKKVQLTATSDNGSGSGYAGWQCTYYVYDDFSQLRAVVQPNAVDLMQSSGNWVPTVTMLTDLFFRYAYDQRGRLVMKQIPGGGTTEMIYNTRDLLVLSRNAREKTAGQWEYFVYDRQDRKINWGIYANAQDRPALKSLADTASYWPGSVIATTNLLSYTFYDDYNWTGSQAFQSSYLSKCTDGGNLYAETASTYSSQTQGLITGTKTKVLKDGTAQWLISTNFYDDKGRTLQVISDNATGGVDVITNKYNFSGQLLSSYQVVHNTQSAGTPEMRILTENLYDAGGRLHQVTKTVNDIATTKRSILTNSYNSLGQLTQVVLGNSLESLTYDYNIRGWLKDINKDYAEGSGDHYFGMELNYDNGAAQNQYNGNIAAERWRSKGDGVRRAFDFSYDPANRLTSGNFTQFNGSAWGTDPNIDFTVNNLTYDPDGNLKTISRKGLKVNSSSTIDHLTYSYKNGEGSNQLLSVTEDASIGSTDNHLGDFTDKNRSGNDYAYDMIGNLTQDKNKGISVVTYNALNLPNTITQNGNTITFLYDASGEKIQKKVTEAGATVSYGGSNYSTNITTTTDYVDGLIYNSLAYSNASLSSLQYSSKLLFIPDENGRIRPVYENVATPTTPSGFTYDYFIKDHLGNVREVLTEEQRQDQYPAATLEGSTTDPNSAVSTEAAYYDMNSAYIVPKSQAVGIPDYPNNNGNPPYNPNPHSSTTANSQQLYKLNGSTNKTGLGITLKVMAGDHVDIFGKSYYNLNGGTISGNPISILAADLLDALLNTPQALGTTHGGITAGTLGGSPTNSVDIPNFLNNHPGQTTTRPRAFINWILFDDQFNYVSGGYSQVGNSGTIKNHYSDASMENISITKNGYLYVYCSNESPINVFFDNLQVIHTRGPLLQEDHYYPFGLTMAGISDQAALSVENQNMFNGKELQHHEFKDNSSLDWYDYGARMYDAQIGRWNTLDPLSEKYRRWSPYNYCDNNPLIFTDPDGMGISNDHEFGGTSSSYLSNQATIDGADAVNASSLNDGIIRDKHNENITATPQQVAEFLKELALGPGPKKGPVDATLTQKFSTIFDLSNFSRITSFSTLTGHKGASNIELVSDVSIGNNLKADATTVVHTSPFTQFSVAPDGSYSTGFDFLTFGTKTDGHYTAEISLPTGSKTTVGLSFDFNPKSFYEDVRTTAIVIGAAMQLPFNNLPKIHTPPFPSVGAPIPGGPYELPLLEN